jgi:hypothetical protein
MLALAEPQAAVTQSADTTSHADLIANYPRRLSDRDLAIGAGIFEASFNAGYQFNSTLGFGEVPYIRYGLSSMWEVVLLGMRMIIAEDAQLIPGLALRFQVHDLAYQHDADNPYNYPLLRPGVFLELRDRFPLHISANLSAGYLANIQADPSLNTGQQVTSQFFPLNAWIEYSPIELFSAVLAGYWIQDVGREPFTSVTQTHYGLSVTAVLVPKSWLDLQALFRMNWYDGRSFGFVPQVGIGATIRL